MTVQDYLSASKTRIFSFFFIFVSDSKVSKIIYFINILVIIRAQTVLGNLEKQAFLTAMRKMQGRLGKNEKKREKSKKT